ncbi:MAG: DUF6110 family protein [Bacillota bacterium]|jgi:hypothetical protein
MHLYCKAALFIGGTIAGPVAVKLLGSRDAKKVYTHTAAAALRCKERIMGDVEKVQENCADILADAKAINEERAREEEAVFVEDESLCEDIAEAAEAE